MEAFTLLNLWRNAGAEAVSDGATADKESRHTVETDDEESFFDLELTATACKGKNESKGSEVRCEARNLIESSNDVFFEGRIVPLEPTSKAQSPMSLLRSAPRFRVFMLGFRRLRFEKRDGNGDSMATPKHRRSKSSQPGQSKRFAVKCEVEEVRIGSLFARDNSLRSKIVKQCSEDAPSDNLSGRLSKDVIRRYIKLIKPLYLRVSKRNGEKVKLSNQTPTATPLSSPASAPVSSPRRQSEEKQGSRSAGLRVVCKHLGKSRSASSTVEVMPSPCSRRDDSLLQQHDGIQNAILHCKRSFNSSRESSISSPCENGESTSPLTKLPDEKRCSI